MLLQNDMSSLSRVSSQCAGIEVPMISLAAYVSDLHPVYGATSIGPTNPALGTTLATHRLYCHYQLRLP